MITISASNTAAFQQAIDSLPAEGGHILVPPGNYQGVVPEALTVPLNKVVLWDATGAELPGTLPGVVLTQGRKDWWAGGKVARTGYVYQHIDLGDQGNLLNGRHRAIHVQGKLSNNPGANDRYLAAYSFYLETDQETVTGGSLRGVYGSVMARGGKANIRAIRVMAESSEGHTGNLTGILGTAHRHDATPGAPGSIATVVGVTGTVGNGGTSCFEANAFAADQRPATAYRVSVSNNGEALLPHAACYMGHGGGEGDIVRGVRGVAGEDASDIILSMDNKARITARSICSGRRAIPDDGFIVIANPSPGHTGFIRFWESKAVDLFGEGYYRTTKSPSMLKYHAGNSKIQFMKGKLNGTTGADGALTISADVDGIYIENRLGGVPKMINWFFTSPGSQIGQLY
jgi:hypothetical protein